MGIPILTFEFDPDMSLFAEMSQLERFDAAWVHLEKREGVALRQLKSVATVRSVGASTRIEGSKITDDEVAVLIEKIAELKPEERDEQEVLGYFEVFDTISLNFDSIAITESEIKSLHKLMLKYADKDEWHKGNYKQVSNAVEARMPDGTAQIAFRTTGPGVETQEAMTRLIEWYKRDDQTTPLIKAATFVYEFLSIHPFQDGNGRLSRLLTNLLLLQNGYSWIQYVSLEHEIENRKAEYYRVLMQTQRNRPGENVTEWVRFFISCLVNIQQQLTKKLEELKTEVSVNTREKKILAFVQNHPGCSSGQISKKLDLPLPTVKKSLKDLVEAKLITREGIGKSTAYFMN
jgi:Fic family protein